MHYSRWQPKFQISLKAEFMSLQLYLALQCRESLKQLWYHISAWHCLSGSSLQWSTHVAGLCFGSLHTDIYVFSVQVHISGHSIFPGSSTSLPSHTFNRHHPSRITTQGLRSCLPDVFCLPLKSWWEPPWCHNSWNMYTCKTSIVWIMPKSATNRSCVWVCLNKACGSLGALI